MVTFRQNYFLFLILCFVMLLTLVLATFFSFMTYSIWTDDSNWVLKITTPLLATLLIWLLFATPNQFSKRFYSITIDTNNKTLVIRFPLRRQETKIQFKDIRGYSKSTDIYSGVWSPKKGCITLYLINEVKVDIVQYQFSGFKKFCVLIEQLNFNFLGKESFIIDFRGRRRLYKY